MSQVSELPALDPADDESQRDYRLLAGGLALLLSRCPERLQQRDFGSALLAYRAIRQQLRLGTQVRLPSYLLNELSHEIALVTDAVTREAARRCLQRNRRQDAMPAPLQAA